MIPIVAQNTKTTKNITSKAQCYYKLLSDEARRLYEYKLLDAPAYILFIVKTRRAAGWKWSFKVKDFCSCWGIAVPTFYRAISKLKTLNLLHWETGEKISVWHSADIAQSEDDSILTDEAILSPEDSLIRENVNITDENPSLTDENGLSPVRVEMAETITSTSFCVASDLDQINLDQSQTGNVAVVLA